MSEAVILLNGVSVMAGYLQRRYEHNEGVVPTISMPNIREALGEVRDMCGYSICIRMGNVSIYYTKSYMMIQPTSHTTNGHRIRRSHLSLRHFSISELALIGKFKAMASSPSQGMSVVEREPRKFQIVTETRRE